MANIADQFGCGEFRIMERNARAPDAPGPAGKTLLVTNGYGRPTSVGVNQKLFLPPSYRSTTTKACSRRASFRT